MNKVMSCNTHIGTENTMPIAMKVVKNQPQQQFSYSNTSNSNSTNNLIRKSLVFQLRMGQCKQRRASIQSILCFILHAFAQHYHKMSLTFESFIGAWLDHFIRLIEPNRIGFVCHMCARLERFEMSKMNRKQQKKTANRTQISPQRWWRTNLLRCYQI